MDVDGDEADSQDQLVKKLVRYALACEYQRIPIKRANITEKGACYIVGVGAGLTQISYVETTCPFQAGIRTCTEATQDCFWNGNG